MNNEIIQIYDGEKLLSFTYEDMLKKHGGEMPGGVALIYKMMLWIFNDVAKEIPRRGNVHFYSGLGENGKGIIDGACFVLGLEKSELNFDKDFCQNKIAPEAPGGGKYYFEIGFNSKNFEIAVKDNVVPKEFFDFSKFIHQKKSAGENITDSEKEKLSALREKLAEAILSTPAENLFVKLN